MIFFFLYLILFIVLIFFLGPDFFINILFYSFLRGFLESQHSRHSHKCYQSLSYAYKPNLQNIMKIKWEKSKCQKWNWYTKKCTKYVIPFFFIQFAKVGIQLEFILHLSLLDVDLLKDLPVNMFICKKWHHASCYSSCINFLVMHN